MPQTPYLVYGIVSDTNSTVVSGVNVIAFATTTSERTPTVVTDSLGRYVIDLGNLASGYTVGDSVTVYVRHNGYTGENTFTISGENSEQDITTSNQVTFATLKNTLWKAVYDTLQTGTFAISEDSIYSAMNDQLISSEGYPLVILNRPDIDRKGMVMSNTLVECPVSFLVEIFHTSDESCKTLSDEVENVFWIAQEVWDGLFLGAVSTETIDNDWYTVGQKKIHIIRFKADFTFYGEVTIA